MTAREVRVSGTRSGTEWKERKPNWKVAKESFDAVVSGRVTPDLQEGTWNADEEVMTGLVYNFGGKYQCALEGKPIWDKESEYTKKSEKTTSRSGADADLERPQVRQKFSSCDMSVIH